MKDFILSPSSLNLFIEEPCLWMLKHFFGMRGSANIYAIRGKLVEDYLNIVIDENKEPSQEDYIKKVLPSIFFDNIEVLPENLEDFYSWGKHCLPVYKETIKDHGALVSRQKYIQGKIGGLTLGGYLDFEFENITVDLKTVSKLPNLLVRGARAGQLPAFKAANIRQQAIYSAITNKTAALLFIDKDGRNLFYALKPEDIEEVKPSIKKAIEEVKNIIDKGFDAIFQDYRPKNTNSMYWDNDLKIKANEIWG